MKFSPLFALFILFFITQLSAQKAIQSAKVDTIPLSKKHKKSSPVYVDAEFGLMPVDGGRYNLLGDISTGYRFSENIALGISSVLTKTDIEGSASGVGVQCRWTPLRFLMLKGEYGYVYDFHKKGYGTYLPEKSEKSYIRGSAAICFLRVFSVGATIFNSGTKAVKLPGSNQPDNYFLYAPTTNIFWRFGVNIPLRKPTVFEQEYLF